MIMTLPAAPPTPEQSPSLDQVLRVFVALLGAIECLNGVTDLSILFGDTAKIPGHSVGGLMLMATIVLRPVLGFAALAFAVTRRLRYGIAALALLALAVWASELPSLIREGVELSGSAFVNITMVLKTFVQPVVALAAIAAAWVNRHLELATVGVMLPTLVDVAGVVAFAISVAIHGF